MGKTSRDSTIALVIQPFASPACSDDTDADIDVIRLQHTWLS